MNLNVKSGACLWFPQEETGREPGLPFQQAQGPGFTIEEKNLCLHLTACS